MSSHRQMMVIFFFIDKTTVLVAVIGEAPEAGRRKPHNHLCGFVEIETVQLKTISYG